MTMCVSHQRYVSHATIQALKTTDLLHITTVFWFTVNTVQSAGLHQATHHNMKELTYERTLCHLREDVSIALHQ